MIPYILGIFGGYMIGNTYCIGSGLKEKQKFADGGNIKSFDEETIKKKMSEMFIAHNTKNGQVYVGGIKPKNKLYTDEKGYYLINGYYSLMPYSNKKYPIKKHFSPLENAVLSAYMKDKFGNTKKFKLGGDVYDIDELSKDLIEKIGRGNTISTKEYASMYEISTPNAYKRLSKLEELGKVYKYGYKTRNGWQDIDESNLKPNSLHWQVSQDFADGGKTNETNETAIEILKQLGGVNRLKIMTGAYNFINLGNGVAFKIKNAKANYIKILLNSMDLYDIEIGRIRGITYKVVAEQKNLYFDQLKPFIEEKTGMYLSL